MANYDPYIADESVLARKQKMADMLAGSATQPIDTFSYNGIQAPISPAAGLAKVLEAWGSKRKANQVNQGEVALNARRGADTTADYSDLAAAMQRKPVQEQQPTSDEAGTLTRPYVKGVPGGLQMSDIAKLRTPEGRAMGMDQANQSQNFGQQMTLEQMKILAAQVPNGYQRGPDGGLTPMAGGPADPATLERNANATRDPMMLEQTYNPATQSMQTLAIPRAQAMAAMQGGQSGPNGQGAVVGQGAPNEQVQRNAKLAVEGQGAARNAASAIIKPDGTIDRATVGTLAVNFPGSAGRQARALFDTALANLVYIKSGAQAGPAEMASARAQYMPSPLDDDKTIRDKVARLDSFFAQSIPGTGPTPAAAPPGPPPSPPANGGYSVRRVN